MMNSILEKVRKVITNPVCLYRSMAKTGGLGDPIIFVLVMAVASAILLGFFPLLGIGGMGAMAVGFAGIILLPIMFLIFSLIGAGIMFVIWKLMGSEESYETSYRCVSYASAIYPITALAGQVPYLGSLVGVAWWMYLMITASTEVHQIAQKTAQMVLGILGGFLILINLSSEMAARRMAPEFEKLEGTLEKIEDMSPEEAGEAVGKFLKGLEKATKEPEGQ